MIILVRSFNVKNGYKNGLTYKDLVGFFAWIASLDKLIGYVYYTNKLSTAVKELPPNKRINYIKQKFIEPILIKENTRSILINLMH